MIENIVNFDDPRERGNLMVMLSQCKGEHRVTIVRHRKRRSDAQNAYYWAVVVPLFAEYVRTEWGEESVSNDEAHAILRDRFLSRDLVNPVTGECVTIPGSSAKLNTVQFNEYLEKCIAFLASCQIRVPEPSRYGVETTKESDQCLRLTA